MNQRADSLKKNLQPFVAQPLIYHSGWLLSHTHAPRQGGNRGNRIEKARVGVIARFSRDAPASNPFVFNLAEHRCDRIFRAHTAGMSNKTSPPAANRACKGGRRGSIGRRLLRGLDVQSAGHG